MTVYYYMKIIDNGITNDITKRYEGSTVVQFQSLECNPDLQTRTAELYIFPVSIGVILIFSLPPGSTLIKIK